MEAPQPRPDRKTIEKNRRDRMKSLYSELDYLITTSSESSSDRAMKQRPDRLDEATNYINIMQERIQKLKDTKRRLIMSSSEHTTNNSTETRLPKIEIQELDSGLKAVLISCSGHDRLIFHESLRVVHEENHEVLSANFSTIGEESLVTLHTFDRGSTKSGSDTTNMQKRLRKAHRNHEN